MSKGWQKWQMFFDGKQEPVHAVHCSDQFGRLVRHKLRVWAVAANCRHLYKVGVVKHDTFCEQFLLPSTLLNDKAHLRRHFPVSIFAELWPDKRLFVRCKQIIQHLPKILLAPVKCRNIQSIVNVWRCRHFACTVSHGVTNWTPHNLYFFHFFQLSLCATIGGQHGRISPPSIRVSDHVGPMFARGCVFARGGVFNVNPIRARKTTLQVTSMPVYCTGALSLMMNSVSSPMP